MPRVVVPDAHRRRFLGAVRGEQRLHCVAIRVLADLDIFDAKLRECTLDGGFLAVTTYSHGRDNISCVLWNEWLARVGLRQQG